MRVSVLGGGSWGTTVASLVARRHDTMLWARDAVVAAEITEAHTNSKYLPGLTLNERLAATDDLERATRHAAGHGRQGHAVLPRRFCRGHRSRGHFRLP